jgi:hypothetical protein
MVCLPAALMIYKTPSPKQKVRQNKKQSSSFVGSVGTNDFDLTIESDGIMRGEERGNG